jgi:hypothetical protein
MIIDEIFEAPQQCPECGGISFSDLILAEKKDACYHKVKASAKVWPSAYASGRLVQCRKKGAANYGNKSEAVAETRRGQIPMTLKPGETDDLEPENIAGFRQLPAYKQGQAAQQKAGKQLIQKSPYTFQSDQDWAYRQGAFDTQQAAMFANFGGTKPLTTTEDSLEEVDRRGFLKGLGAAAVAGAAGGVATKADAQEVTQWTKYATDLATRTMGRIHQDTGYDLRNWLVTNVGNWVSDYCRQTNSYNAKNVIDTCNQQAYEASGLDKENKLVSAFLTNMKNRYQDFLNAYRAGISEAYQKYNSALQSQQQQKSAMGNLGKEEFDVLIDALIVYAICKDRQLDNSDLFKAVAASIKRFIDANNAKDYDELSFLGSQCTKDCSGHRAGYEWSKRKGLRQANSWSPSFNKGAGLAVAGK